MSKINYCLFLASFLFFSKASRATTWQTVSNGFWNSPSTWSTGIVPPLTSSDTFNFTFHVAIQNNLVFNSGARINIDSTGGICGHYKLKLNSGSKLTGYGILELDTLQLQSGVADFYGPSQVTLTVYGIISGAGASLTCTGGCAMAVGPWFNCQQPEYSFVNGIEENDALQSIRIYPNPADEYSIITYQLSGSSFVEISLYNLLGKETGLLKTDQPPGSYGLPLKVNELGLAKGLYFVKLKVNDDQKTIKMIVK